MISKYTLFFSLLGLICFSNPTISFGQTNPCLQISSFKIVVLGSSTAAGAGVSTSDSAWVNRYRNYLESINPNNQVINLAVGGYNTYRIMPTGFTPPSNRPNPNPSKNISAAIAENPDAIIVNMPSNDVASGFSYSEQMFNLDTIVQIASANNIPIWICTTQPRNFSNSSALQLQSDLKDSINTVFSPFTIDFWTLFANTNHTINPVYNSGDGVHLNDNGHALLNQRVINTDILSTIYSPSSQIDYALQSIVVESSECGDSSTIVQIKIANQGVLDTINSTLFIQSQNSITNESSIDSILFSPIQSCDIDTFSFNINTYAAGNYIISTYIMSQNDINSQNDSILEMVTSLGHPLANPVYDTLCTSGYGNLVLNQQSIDTSFWYTSFNDSVPFFNGSSFQSQFIDTTTEWFVKTTRGNLFHSSNLTTTTTSNINWNGSMFNLVTQQNIILDSIGLKINTPGLQNIDIYYKTGSYIGHENNSSSWTLLTSTSAFIYDSLALTYYTLPAFSLTSNDTFGIYIQLSNPQSKLSYQSASNPIVRSNSELTIITGTGISHNFTGNYFPRDLNCDIRYHFGSRPEGACSTGKYPATIFVSNYTLNIGNDTIIDFTDSISVHVPNGLNNWYWNLNNTDSNITVTGNELGTGIHYIILSGYDSLQCFKTDDMVVGVANLVNITDTHSIDTKNVYPNPTKNWVYSDLKLSKVSVFSINGSLILSAKHFPINISNLPSGVYYFKTETSQGKIYYSKVVKE